MSEFVVKRVLNDFYKYNTSKFKYMATDNALYHIDELLFIVDQAINDYNYEGFKSTDVILDIGACNGGFSLEIHNYVKKVYAVEPIYYNELCANIQLNSADNIIPYYVSLGRSCTSETIEFMGRKSTVKCKSLTELIDMCGGIVDVLKLDCEGAEWNIQPHELQGIRKIEAEIHSFSGERLLDFFDMLNKSGFSTTISEYNNSTMLISANKTNRE
jgi:FkbM family methyltransferase